MVAVAPGDLVVVQGYKAFLCNKTGYNDFLTEKDVSVGGFADHLFLGH